MKTLRLWFVLLWIMAFLWPTIAAAGDAKNLLLVGQSRDNHPPGTHEYMAGVDRLAKWLAPTPSLTITVAKADDPWTDGPAAIEQADAVLLFVSEGARWLGAEPRRYEAFTRLAARGGGLAALHWALGTRDAEPIASFVKLFGGCHGGPDRKYQVIETLLRVSEHPITTGIGDFSIRDEFYYRLKFPAHTTGLHPLLTATIDEEPHTVAWALERPDGGRSFGFTGLHFDDNWQRPEYQRLVTQAVRWTLKFPPDSPDEVGRKPR